MPNSFLYINGFIIFYKLARVSRLLEVFFQFYMLDLKKDAGFFHIAPINIGGNISFAFMSYKDSWSGWKKCFFFTLKERS